MLNRAVLLAVTALAFSAMTACGGGDAPKRSDEPAAAKTAAGGSPAVKPTGKIIEVKMISDAKGERYDPVEIEGSPGDVIRFVLSSGVHNVNFLPEKNPKGVKLPQGPGAYLQMPGQKFDVMIEWPEGKYYFQCDAHVALGMIGYVEVEDSN